MIVNYNGWPDVVRLVDRLRREPDVAAGRVEVVVVDNASDGLVPEDLDPLPRGVRLVVRGDNGGFSAGVNAGWRSSPARWVLLLNPDVEVEAGFLAKILGRVAAFDARPEGPPAVVGFALLNPDGSRQPSVGVEPGLLRSLRGQFIPRSRRKYQSDRRVKPGSVPWVTGACALVHADLLRALNGMDEEFFLYYEEVALCRAARRLGRGVEFDPSVEVVHLRPLQNREVSPRMRVITRHSKLLYFRKFLPRWEFLTLSWIVTAESWLRGAVARVRGDFAAAGAWREIFGIASAMRRGQFPVGVEVRDRAMSAVRWKSEVFLGRPMAVGRWKKNAVEER